MLSKSANYLNNFILDMISHYTVLWWLNKYTKSSISTHTERFFGFQFDNLSFEKLVMLIVFALKSKTTKLILVYKACRNCLVSFIGPSGKTCHSLLPQFSHSKCSNNNPWNISAITDLIWVSTQQYAFRS